MKKQFHTSVIEKVELLVYFFFFENLSAHSEPDWAYFEEKQT